MTPRTKCLHQRKESDRMFSLNSEKFSSWPESGGQVGTSADVHPFVLNSLEEKTGRKSNPGSHEGQTKAQASHP